MFTNPFPSSKPNMAPSVPKRVTFRGNPFGYRSRHIRFTTRKRIGKHIGLRIGLRIGKQIGLRIGKQIGLRIGKRIGLGIGVKKRLYQLRQ